VSPGNDSRPLVQAALQGLEQIYQPGWEYLKAGVMLLDIRPRAAGWTGDLLTDRDPGRSAALMRTLDTINARMGASTLRLAGEGTSQDWAMHRSKLSGACTTQLRWLTTECASARLRFKTSAARGAEARLPRPAF